MRPTRETRERKLDREPPPFMTERERLSAAATLLCGERWQRPLARLFSINDRDVRRWVAGDRPIPAWVWLELEAAIATREGEMKAAMAIVKSPRVGDVIRLTTQSSTVYGKAITVVNRDMPPYGEEVAVLGVDDSTITVKASDLTTERGPMQHHPLDHLRLSHSSAFNKARTALAAAGLRVTADSLAVRAFSDPKTGANWDIILTPNADPAEKEVAEEIIRRLKIEFPNAIPNG
jgi:hypothetical protein